MARKETIIYKRASQKSIDLVDHAHFLFKHGMDRYTRRLVKVSEFASFFIRWLFDETQLSLSKDQLLS